MNRIANDMEKFEDQIQKFDNALNKLETGFEEMAIHMRELNSMWTGEAHDEFLITFENDEKMVLKMIEYMKVLLSNLNYADTEYANCESTVSHMIEQIVV